MNVTWGSGYTERGEEGESKSQWWLSTNMNYD